MPTFFSPCPRGLEPALLEELTHLGADAPQTVPGGVRFSGNWALCYRVNLHSRIATRVLWEVAHGHYQTEEDVYRLAFNAPWSRGFAVTRRFRVFVNARQSPLRSLEFITLRIKDAVCDHFRRTQGVRPDVDTASPQVRIHAFLDRHQIHLYLDTSGEPLYKRGFKKASVQAPLKENLAAGLLWLSGWKPDEAFCDPMCGSGTFLIEAAQMALNIAPGLNRHFGFELLNDFDSVLWEGLCKAARQAQKPMHPLPIFGSDVCADTLSRARINLEEAGLSDVVRTEEADFFTRSAPAPAGVLVTNPPYGVRLGDKDELAERYPDVGNALKAHWTGWRTFLISGDPALVKRIGLKAKRRIPIFNGALECRFYEYPMVAGQLRHRPEPDADSGGLSVTRRPHKGG
jgi:putative N6-adenine-specific DNA methylase